VAEHSASAHANRRPMQHGDTGSRIDADISARWAESPPRPPRSMRRGWMSPAPGAGGGRLRKIAGRRQCGRPKRGRARLPPSRMPAHKWLSRSFALARKRSRLLAKAKSPTRCHKPGSGWRFVSGGDEVQSIPSSHQGGVDHAAVCFPGCLRSRSRAPRSKSEGH
jgi:hypothetical protein